MSAEERDRFGPPASRLVTAIGDYVQALNSPNGHPHTAGEELAGQIQAFAAEILRQARSGATQV